MGQRQNHFIGIRKNSSACFRRCQMARLRFCQHLLELPGRRVQRAVIVVRWGR